MSADSPLLVFNTKLLNAADASVDITSASVSIQLSSGFSVQSIWTGNIVGTINIQVSCDGINFTTVAQPAPAGTADSNFFEFDWIHASFVRIFYQKTSGTGNLTAIVAGKRF